jgi:UDPglucose 6-dehydrogenase
MRVTVIGTGYLGATHAACMAELGWEVLGVDIDPGRVAALSDARVPFYEPGLDEMIRRHVKSGRLSFTTSLQRAAEFGDVHFLCVGTPQQADTGSADLRYLYSAIDGMAPHLRRSCLIVGKSTVPVGTAERLTERLRQHGVADVPVEIAWNPEFLQESTAVQNTLNPDRLVFGVGSDFARTVLYEIYAELIDRGVPVIVTDIATSELIKASANAFLATKLSFINAIAEVCEAADADVRKLAEALSFDPRIGHTYMQPGIGFGGGCLPKDLRALRARAEELGVGRALRFLGEVDEINLRARERMIELAREECGGSLAGRRICVLGAAFKPNSDDIRDSPALAVAAALRQHGSLVSVYDPKAADNARKEFPDLDYALSAAEAAQDADLVLHLTEWPEFAELAPAEIADVVAERRILDGRNTLDAERWRAAGWRYRALGRHLPEWSSAGLLPGRLPAA